MIRLAQIDAEFMDACPRLRVIGRAGVGVDNIDVEAATNRGIQVINVPDYCIEEVATHAASLLLSSWRRLPVALKLGAEGRWWDWSEVTPIRPLSSCTLGLVGMGRMGRALHEMVGDWFEEVIFVDPAVSDAPPNTRQVTLDELFSKSDVISLHAPSIPETVNLVNASRLAQLKEDTLLINVARGDLIDEEALLAGLANGKPSRAALDVLTVEPPDPSHPLLHHPQVQVTNHMAWLSTESHDNVRSFLARRCAQALVGLSGETVVNARALQEAQS